MVSRRQPMIVVADINPSELYDVTSASKLVSASAKAIQNRCMLGELHHTRSNGGRYVIRGSDLIDRAKYEQHLNEEEKRKSYESRLEKKRLRNREERAKQSRQSDSLGIGHQSIKQAVLAEIDRLRARVSMMPD